MKKSIIFGVMAMFAISALSIQNVNAQINVTKVGEKKEKVKVEEAEKVEKTENPQFGEAPKTESQVTKAKGGTFNKKNETTMKNENNSGKKNADEQQSELKKKEEKKHGATTTKVKGGKFDRKKDNVMKDETKSGTNSATQKNEGNTESSKFTNANSQKDNKLPEMKSSSTKPKAGTQAKKKTQQLPDYQNGQEKAKQNVNSGTNNVNGKTNEKVNQPEPNKIKKTGDANKGEAIK